MFKVLLTPPTFKRSLAGNTAIHPQRDSNSDIDARISEDSSRLSKDADRLSEDAGQLSSIDFSIKYGKSKAQLRELFKPINNPIADSQKTKSYDDFLAVSVQQPQTLRARQNNNFFGEVPQKHKSSQQKTAATNTTAATATHCCIIS